MTSERHPAHRFKRFVEKHLAAGYWVKAGLVPGAATRLVRAGIVTLEDLARLSREDFLAIRGVAEESLARCEALFGRPLPSIKRVWEESGLAPVTVHALHRAGIDTPEQLAAQTRESFLAKQGLGIVTLRACETFLGRKLDSPTRYWRDQGMSSRAARALARARVRSREDLAAIPVWYLTAIGMHEADVADCKRKAKA